MSMVMRTKKMKKHHTKHSTRLLKNLKKALAFVFLAALITSCIPNEKVIYVQNKEDDPSLRLDSLISLSRQDYRLQPNDILIINFYSGVPDAVQKFLPLASREGSAGGGTDPNQSGGAYLSGFNLDKEGNIEVPSLGRVKASGLTTFELKYRLEELIKEKDGIIDILVNVKLDGIRYTIFGEVGGTGLKNIQRYEANIIEAIASVGGMTLNANRQHVQIIRQYPDGVRFHEVDVTDRNLVRSKFYFLQPNDIIYVPPLKIREIGAGTTALENLAVIIGAISSATIIINLLGNNNGG